ncbi:SMAD/FHA domain-containing protein [Carex rostrata]
MTTIGDEVVEVGFAKLQGEDFEYYMQTYSIMLGRNSKKSSVDVDLASLGGGMNISRHHARIYYDFPRKRFALEVIGKNGCTVENVLYLPGSAPIKLDSQDLLQIGDKRFYFLLPTRSVFDTFAAARQIAAPLLPPSVVVPPPSFGQVRRHPMFHETFSNEDSDPEEREGNREDSLGLGHGGGAVRGMMVKKKLKAREAEASYGVPRAGMEEISLFDKKMEPRARSDRETDNQQLMQLEEKDVVSSVANVLSDLCGPGEWMPMARLHSELMEQYGNVWHHSRVRRYLTSDDWPPHETKGKPWFGLLTLLRKYPEHFVINTRSKGRVTSEFVSLVSLLS